jgi:hypothetical protein
VDDLVRQFDALPADMDRMSGAADAAGLNHAAERTFQPRPCHLRIVPFPSCAGPLTGGPLTGGPLTGGRDYIAGHNEMGTQPCTYHYPFTRTDKVLLLNLGMAGGRVMTGGDLTFD